MKIVRWVAAGVAAIVVLLVAASFLLPRHAVVSRSQHVAAPPSSIYPIVGDLRRFNEWSPWYERDPDAVYTFIGPTDGVGQTMRWRSDDPAVGEGAIAIERLEPEREVEMAVDFGDRGTATTWIVLERDGDETRVTWRFSADLGFNPVSRYFGMWFDGPIGPDYEKGLANLKSVVESQATERESSG